MLKENEMHRSQLFIMVYFLHRMNLEQQLWGRTSIDTGKISCKRKVNIVKK